MGLLLVTIMFCLLQERTLGFKILTVDTLGARTMNQLESLGAEVVSVPADKRVCADLRAIMAEHRPSCVIVRSSKMSKETVLSANEELGLIIRAGAGYDNIDLNACASRGIAVSNTPGCNAVAVAELTMGMMIALDRKLVKNSKQLGGQQQVWQKEDLSKGQMGLFGSTLGLIGAGNIGTEVIKRAAAFGMPIALWGRTLCLDIGQRPVPITTEQVRRLGLESAAAMVPITLYPSIAQVAAEADVLSVHCKQPSRSPPLIDREVLAALKPGAIFINTARADLVHAEALLEALQDPARNLRAGLDVWWKEPRGTGPFEDVTGAMIAKLPNVLPCSHIGAATMQAQAAVSDKLIRNVEAFLKDSSVLNSVLDIC